MFQGIINNAKAEKLQNAPCRVYTSFAFYRAARWNRTRNTCLWGALASEGLASGKKKNFLADPTTPDPRNDHGQEEAT